MLEFKRCSWNAEGENSFVILAGRFDLRDLGEFVLKGSSCVSGLPSVLG